MHTHSYWLSWSGLKLTTFIQLYNIDLVDPITSKADLSILYCILLNLLQQRLD